MRVIDRGGLEPDADPSAYLNNRQYLNLLSAHRLRMQDLIRVHHIVLSLIDELEGDPSFETEGRILTRD